MVGILIFTILFIKDLIIQINEFDFLSYQCVHTTRVPRSLLKSETFMFYLLCLPLSVSLTECVLTVCNCHLSEACGKSPTAALTLTHSSPLKSAIWLQLRPIYRTVTWTHGRLSGHSQVDV